MDYYQEDLHILAEYIKLSAIKNSRLFITGGTGLIGSVCAKAFLTANKEYNLENEVNILVRDAEKADRIYDGFVSYGLHYIEGDVCQQIPTIDCDYIIHTASPTSSGYFISHPAEVLDIIYSGTKNILELAKECNAQSMVCLSSMEAFGAVKETDHRLKEYELGYIDISDVRSCYSEGKRVLELMCRCYSEEYGINVCIARLAQTFGAGVLPTENRVFAQFARSAVKGENIVLHTLGRTIGNYCYIRDTVKAIITLLLNGQKGEIYTVANESTSMSIREMAELVAENFSNGRSQVVFEIPDGNKFGYAPETKIRLSSEKLQSLGWKPEVDIVEMYRRMIPYI